MNKLLPFLLLSLLAFPWEMGEDLIHGFNFLGDGKTIVGICLLLEQSAKSTHREAGKDGLNAFLTAGGVTLLLKQITHCKRPTGKSYDSFPSGHTAVAFASARIFSHYYPENKTIYYLLAVGVAIARVQSRAHYTRDVIGGALVGYWGGELALKDKGIIPILKKRF